MKLHVFKRFNLEIFPINTTASLPRLNHLKFSFGFVARGNQQLFPRVSIKMADTRAVELGNAVV